MTLNAAAAAGPDVNAGMLAFVAFVFLALALWLLMRNMNSRLRRMSYQHKQDHPQAPASSAAAPEAVDLRDQEGRLERWRESDGPEEPGRGPDA